MARLYSQLGYEGMFFATSDEDLRQQFKDMPYDSHQVDFLWNTGNHSMFTSMISGTGCTMDGKHFFDVSSKGSKDETQDSFVADPKLADEFNS